MESTNKEAVNLLNDLLERNYDAEKGYKKAAEDSKSPVLKDFFRDYASQRYDFGHELKSEIRRLGGDPEKGTSTASSLHRTWIDIKTALSSDKDETVVEECIRGEKAALDDYEDVLKKNELPISSREVIQRQHDKIQAAVNRLNQIERTL
ncbi:PA2169 family four-helix-bundle protein [Cesiribacter sp. SM1]|uniref:ferritin-like domain-containing protein n=1 Tax=Cesiribacter sp. SM1 TaxID=2861196 RepID=UPI001CD6E43A|nr:PA2169 family four-helix-bundle protein [Cesiribacter sp. SM1]